MKKELLIFGAYGALGRGITDVMIKKDYDKIYLFDFGIGNNGIKDKHVENIEIQDLSKEENVIKAFQHIKEDKNKYLFLYSTVGGFFGGKPLWETEFDDWNKMIMMNLNTNFLIAKHFSSLVRESSGGSICLTAAHTGLVPEKNKAAYGISKSGVVHLVKSLAKEGESIRMSVNGIAPYIIDTPANRNWTSNGDYEKWTKPSEIGELAHNLFSNFYFISGNIITLATRFTVK